MAAPRDVTVSGKGPDVGEPRRRIGRPLTYPPDEERSMMIRAAYRALAREGVGTVPISDILAEAGLSTRSFYRHFKSKDELLLAMFQAESERATQELTQIVERAPDPRTAVEDWVRFYIALAFEPRRHRRTSVMQTLELLGVPGYSAVLARGQECNRAPLVRALEAGAADGSFRHTQPAVDAVMIQDLAGSVLMRRRDGIEQNDSDTVLASIVGFLVRALGMSD